MKAVLLSVLVLVELHTATLTVEHPELQIKAPVIVGRKATPTPTGIYLLKKAYSTKLNMPVLVFMRDEGAVWAIHPSLVSRAKQLQSVQFEDNALSAGCIGISDAQFERLWSEKRDLILQVYE
jgi:hypothetical protein